MWIREREGGVRRCGYIYIFFYNIIIKLQNVDKCWGGGSNNVGKTQIQIEGGGLVQGVTKLFTIFPAFVT